MRIEDIETPAVLIDLDILERNINQMQQHLSANSIQCRPHIKTHKIPAIAHMQMSAGAVGITCQKLSEAEVMVNNGLRDILIPYNIVGKKKIERLIRLCNQAAVAVTVDSDGTLRGLSEAMSAARLQLSVLVECDTGAGRAGVQRPDQVIALAELIQSLPGVEFKGLLTFKGGAPDLDHIKHSSAFFEETTETLFAKGISVETISAGGTVYAHGAWPDQPPFGVTECRPGVYAYYDHVKVSFGVATFDDCAMRITTTVVSRPATERVIVDAGAKTLTNDGFHWVDGFGHMLEYPDAKVAFLSEEHGIVDMSASHARPSIGDRVTIIPNYCNGVTNVHDVVYGVRGDLVETIWPVAARGKSL